MILREKPTHRIQARAAIVSLVLTRLRGPRRLWTSLSNHSLNNKKLRPTPVPKKKSFLCIWKKGKESIEPKEKKSPRLRKKKKRKRKTVTVKHITQLI
jgi:hypothetical protein